MEIPEATPEKPVLGLLLSIDSRSITETVLEVESIWDPGSPAREAVPGLSLARWDDRFTDVLARVLTLLDDPAALRILGSGRMQGADVGARCRGGARAGASASDVAIRQQCGVF